MLLAERDADGLMQMKETARNLWLAHRCRSCPGRAKAGPYTLRRDPTPRLRARINSARRRVGACFSTPNETSDSDVESPFPYELPISIIPHWLLPTDRLYLL